MPQTTSTSGIAGHGQRQTAAHLGKVGALGDDVDGSGLDAGQIEHPAERNAFPDGVPDCIVAPWGAGWKWFEAGASVPGTFEKCLDPTRAEALQIVEREESTAVRQCRRCRAARSLGRQRGPVRCERTKNRSLGTRRPLAGSMRSSGMPKFAPP